MFRGVGAGPGAWGGHSECPLVGGRLRALNPFFDLSHTIFVPGTDFRIRRLRVVPIYLVHARYQLRVRPRVPWLLLGYSAVPRTSIVLSTTTSTILRLPFDSTFAFARFCTSITQVLIVYQVYSYLVYVRFLP